MKLPNKTLKAWAFYDFANSSYVLIFQSFLLPVFFSSMLFTRGYDLESWGIANGISTFFGVFASIIIGKYSDKGNRLGVFKFIIILTFTSMVLLSFATNFWITGVNFLYILTNTIFIVSLTLSDSILPHISDKNNTYSNSGFAWGFGYIGGIISMIIVILLQYSFSEYSYIVFLSVALFYIIFSLISLNGLKSASLDDRSNSTEVILISNRNKAILLIGYWLISECITVIILFYSIYANKELHLSSTVIGATLLGVQFVGFFSTWYGGYLTNRLNTITLIGITTGIWGIIVFLLVNNFGMFGLIAIVILTGLVIGNSQSYLRGFYSMLIPKKKSGFEFGIYAITSEASVIVGPILYGKLSDQIGSQKIPLIILFSLMVIGFLIIKFIVSGNTNLESKQII